MTVSAAVRLIPRPPALVLSRNRNTSGSLENLVIWGRRGGVWWHSILDMIICYYMLTPFFFQFNMYYFLPFIHIYTLYIARIHYFLKLLRISTHFFRHILMCNIYATCVLCAVLSCNHGAVLLKSEFHYGKLPEGINKVLSSVIAHLGDHHSAELLIFILSNTTSYFPSQVNAII